MGKVHISVVSPVYMAENLLETLVEKVSGQLETITNEYEIILVEDGSPDRSWEKVEEACQRDKRVRGIKLSRNFGQHYAISAGLENAAGEWVVVMDCDLQDKPEEIPRLYQEVQKGYDIVFAKRTFRTDGPAKRLSNYLYFKTFSYLTDTKQDRTIGNFGIYHQKVVQAMNSMNDHIRYFPTMSKWVGFNKTSLPVKHGERETGKSSYTWRKLFQLAFNNIIAFSDKPLRLTIRLGIFIALFSGLIGVYYLVRYLTGSIEVLGFASLIVSIWFLSGVIIFILGVIGVYLGKVFEKVKGRPTYIIDKKLNPLD